MENKSNYVPLFSLFGEIWKKQKLIGNFKKIHILEHKSFKKVSFISREQNHRWADKQHWYKNLKAEEWKKKQLLCFRKVSDDDLLQQTFFWITSLLMWKQRHVQTKLQPCSKLSGEFCNDWAHLQDADSHFKPHTFFSKRHLKRQMNYPFIY